MFKECLHKMLLSLLLTYFPNAFAALVPSRSVQSFSQLMTLLSWACFAGAAEHSNVKHKSVMTATFMESLKPEIEKDEILHQNL